MKHRIVVLGAGYAGAVAAGRLAKRLHSDDTQITVVNADTEFVERVRMHQLATGQQLKRRTLTDIYAGTGVEVRQARVTAVDVDRKTVALVAENGADEIGYDTLVYALGSASADHGVPGVVEHAYDIAGRPSALRLRDRLDHLAAGGTVLVVGGGLTGLEAVTEIAEARPDLDVAIAARGGLGDWLNAKAQQHLRGVCDRLGITVHEHTDIARVEATGAVTADGRVLPAQVTVWTTGFAVHPIAAATTLTVAPTGQIVVDATMRSVSHPDVYAVGDAGLADGPGGKPLRMSCASGVPMAWQAADAIAARLTGRKIPKAPLRYFNQCISLGRRDGIIQYVTADDRAKPSLLTGRLAARYKEIVCTGAAWGIAHPTLHPVRRHHIAATRTETLTAIS
ncbi:NAD(P)/FAD-dependent oxidoreductase [Micromonospora parathelypteridis]|uniref:NADH dehydrogenase FAD-containing subunit n=1 Tax=Micromonospora parathelypteridis TaxID=1839617 RepID=A0A840VJG7_9ACTN|nr:FAD-dependent oxidoreductase [Micromonospora parathelypteridis]MBB5476887.1 NADH dehydrogenase FAD-containing subunit [Micromonospora parathelypteridis]GGO17514.1 oxidoreductase [Micromonospora parathelypteridis]